MQTEAESGAHGAVVNWGAVILAGEDGKRLLPLTRRFPGDDPPKQLCNLRGNQTLLNQTLRRVERVINPDRTFSIVTKAHESFYREHNGGAPLGEMKMAGLALSRSSVTASQGTFIEKNLELLEEGEVSSVNSGEFRAEDDAIATDGHGCACYTFETVRPRAFPKSSARVSGVFVAACRVGSQLSRQRRSELIAESGVKPQTDGRT